MPNKTCMSESTDACRVEEGDSAETCMQQAYNYLHSTHIFSYVLDAMPRVRGKAPGCPENGKRTFFFGKPGFTFAS
jgi:hypothetical protein